MTGTASAGASRGAGVDGGAARDTGTLATVIVTYNAARYIDDCLDALAAAQPRDLESTVHVVDNASGDDTVRIVREGHPGVRLLENATNDGFAKANNRALAVIDSEYVLVLNPDTRMAPGVLDVLIEHFADPRVAVVGCRLERLDGTFDHASKRNLPTRSDALRYFLGRLGLRTSSGYTAPDVDERGIGTVEAVNGAFMLIRGAALDQVGPLDERYWMYGEDLDWCRRFLDADWKIVYDGTQTIVHLKGAASGTHRPLRLNLEFHKSMALYYRKFDGGHSATADALTLAAIWLRFAGSAAVSGVARSRVRVGTARAGAR